MPENAPCTLRLNSKTGQKGDVTGEEAAKSNKYNQNFKNRFCGCGEDYDAHQEKGTMFQCLGLGTVDEGGCGEDWWHPECLVGFTREEYTKSIEKPEANDTNVASIQANAEANGKAESEVETTSAPHVLDGAALERNGVDGNEVVAAAEEVEDEDLPLPPGFPPEDDFDHFLCYKCVESNPWIKKYAGSPGFLPPVYTDKALNATQPAEPTTSIDPTTNGESKKRKASDEGEDQMTDSSLSVPALAKRQKSEDPTSTLSSIPEDTAASTLPATEETTTCKEVTLPSLPTVSQSKPFSLFLKPDFRNHLCHCPTHFPLLKPHPQLLEEEDTYEPPISEADDEGAASVGTGSLLDRGEAAFSNMDRVRAIQGAMAYAQLKDKVSAFLKPFAESGQAVGAEDVKAYFEKLRGDAAGIQEAASGAKDSRGDGEDGTDGSNRKEQSGY